MTVNVNSGYNTSWKTWLPSGNEAWCELLRKVGEQYLHMTPTRAQNFAFSHPLPDSEGVCHVTQKYPK